MLRFEPATVCQRLRCAMLADLRTALKPMDVHASNTIKVMTRKQCKLLYQYAVHEG